MDYENDSFIEDSFCNECKERKSRLFNKSKNRSSVTLGTLGPEGTTSCETAKEFRKYFKSRKQIEFNIGLYDTFELALDDLYIKKIDFVLLPNAYGRMTNFYWDPKIELVFSFVNMTPRYGIAVMSDNKKTGKDHYTISVCKAVEHLVREMWDSTEYRDNPYRLVEANSTARSLMLLEDEKVDFALTNDSSLSGSKAHFISKNKSTKVLWSIFMLKNPETDASVTG